MKTDEKKTQLVNPSKAKEEESKVIDEPLNTKEKDLNSLNEQQEINSNNEEQLENELNKKGSKNCKNSRF